MEQVVLVDENDNEIGLVDKLGAHQGKGKLHRAVSLFLYRQNHDTTELLLQQRGSTKPLWPLFWSNTVCTHPRPTEIPVDCATRRLKEEMGISLVPSTPSFQLKLLYQADYNANFSENELDHIFVAEFNGEPKINKNEVNNWKWIKLADLLAGLQNQPEIYTPWLKLAIQDKRLLKTITQP